MNIVTIRGFRSSATLLRETPTNLKGKKHSSQLWLTRQLQDPYVEKARQEKYRCRSAFKLLEINDRFKIFQPGMTVVDCGAAPGSWTQVAVKLVNSDGKTLGEERKGSVVAIDKLPIHPIDGATVFGNLDFTTEDAQTCLKDVLNGQAVDLIMSDMAPNATGVKTLDHDTIITLAYAALKFALQISKIDGTFVTKVWDGAQSPQLEKDLNRFYKTIRIVKPNATRDESTEKFILCRGFKGLKV